MSYYSLRLSVGSVELEAREGPVEESTVATTFPVHIYIRYEGNRVGANARRALSGFPTGTNLQCGVDDERRVGEQVFGLAKLFLASARSLVIPLRGTNKSGDLFFQASLSADIADEANEAVQQPRRPFRTVLVDGVFTPSRLSRCTQSARQPRDQPSNHFPSQTGRFLSRACPKNVL